MPNAPSPTFPALQGTSPVLLSHEGGSFSFMHDSKIDRSEFGRGWAWVEAEAEAEATRTGL